MVVVGSEVPAHHGSGLDVRPLVQKNLDGLEEAFLSSPVECSGSTLPENIYTCIQLHAYTYIQTNINIKTCIYIRIYIKTKTSLLHSKISPYMKLLHP